MKRTTLSTVICVMILTLALSLISCSSDASAEKSAVCFVVANTANSQGLNLNSPILRDTVYQTVRNYGFIAVVNADGNPETVIAKSFDIADQYKNASKQKLDKEANTKASALLSAMQSIVADDPEVDYLSSLKLAVRCLSSLEGYDSKTIVVLGTGLSTVGVMDFNNNLLSTDAETLVRLLDEREEIPDMTGITVYFQQLGDVAAPQKELTSAQRSRLRDIYRGIIEAGGGTFKYSDIIANPVNENASYPAVTPVELPSDTPIIFDPDIFEPDETSPENNVADSSVGDVIENPESDAVTETEEVKVLESPIIFTEQQITFLGDKAEYRNPEDAMKTLEPVAEFLSENSIVILLCGTTAGDSDTEFGIILSRDRAEAVKQTLVSLGVDADRIIAIGLGSEKDPWHVWGIGLGTEGSINRKVVLLDAYSKTGQEILAEINS